MRGNRLDRHLWPSCMPAYLLCRFWFWAIPEKIPVHYADEHDHFLLQPFAAKKPNACRHGSRMLRAA